MLVLQDVCSTVPGHGGSSRRMHKLGAAVRTLRDDAPSRGARPPFWLRDGCLANPTRLDPTRPIG
jgi:hypothetical protein